MEPIYFVLVAVCVLSMMAMGFHARNNPILDPSSKRWFVCLFLVVALGASAECLGVYLNLHPLTPGIHRAVKLTEFCATPFLAVATSRACKVKKQILPVSVVALLHTLVELATAPFGLIFYIDPQGIYHRGPWYAVYIASYAVSFGYLIVMFALLSRRFRQRDIMTLFFSVNVMLVGVIPSVLASRVKTAFLGVTMTAILFYGYYEGLTEQDVAADMAQKNARISAMQDHTIMGMAMLIESRDQSTGDHVKNTADYVRTLALGALAEGMYPEIINERFVEQVIQAAPMHDIGKIAVPDAILQKPGQLTEDEYEIMRTHASVGGKLIRQVLSDITDEEYTRIAWEVATCHHERWDGNGYPEGLAGEQIPVSARIMAIADVYDAITMERVYKKALPPETALKEIAAGAGTQFDPLLAPLFVRLMGQELSETA